MLIIIFELLPYCNVGLWACEWSSQLSPKPPKKDKHLEMSPVTQIRAPSWSQVWGPRWVTGGWVSAHRTWSTICSKVQKGPLLCGEIVKRYKLEVVKLPCMHSLSSGICWGRLGSLLLWSCWWTGLVIKPCAPCSSFCCCSGSVSTFNVRLLTFSLVSDLLSMSAEN